MTQPNTNDLLEKALKLPADERLALATELLKSVEGPEDTEWSEAWLAEVDRRAAAVERGEEPLESWESVEARIAGELQGR